MVSPLEIAQALQQGQVAPIASTTGVVPQPPNPFQAQAQALQQFPQQAEEPFDVSGGFATPQGSSLASELLGVRDDRLGNPIIRGLAGFVGAKQLRTERESAERERQTQAEAATRRAELEERAVEADIALKTRQGQKFDAEAAKLSAEAARGGDPKEIFKQETKVRGEFRDTSKEFIKQRDAFNRVKASAKDPSAAGDLALIFNFMKVLDPGSTVREGEFATAAASAGLGERIIAAALRVDTGERLAPEQRQDFLDRGTSLFAAANNQHNQRIQTFTGLSERLGLNPENIVIEFGLAEEEVAKEGEDQLTATEQTFTRGDIKFLGFE